MVRYFEFLKKKQEQVWPEDDGCDSTEKLSIQEPL